MSPYHRITFAFFALAAPLAVAECAPFHEAFESAAAVAANGGSITPTVTFASAINGNGATLGPTGHISYFGPGFRTPRGSVSLWYKRTATTASGGIWQIGSLSQPSSIGLVYLDTDDLMFEMRASNNNLAQLTLADAFPQNVWVHVAVAWHEDAGATYLEAYVNGGYRGWTTLAGTLEHTIAPLQVGHTGYYNHGQGVVDELRFFDWDLIDSEAYGEYVVSSGRFRLRASTKPVSTGPVQLIGNCLYVNGQPFKVKGVGYAPTPNGAWNDYPTYTDSAILARDVPLLRAMNVNTVRTWAQPPNNMLLDAMYSGGVQPIYTIIGFWVPVSGIDYGDPAVISQYETLFRNLVNQFKNHPGLLAWGIGNEVNLSNSGTSLRNWYILANRLAQVAYLAEGATYHPTILVNGALSGLGNVDNASDDISLSAIDVWGQNTYFGWDAHCFFDYYAQMSAKPLVFTEFGIDAWNNVGWYEYQDVQAAWEVRQWRQIRSACLGATVMAYSDEWWKADYPSSHDFGGYSTKTHPDSYSNEEWWGVVSTQDNGSGPDIVTPRQAYYALGQEFAHSLGDHDGDADIDLADLAAFQVCSASTTGLCGTVFEYVVDDTLDVADFALLSTCLNGPSTAPACCR